MTKLFHKTVFALAGLALTATPAFAQTPLEIKELARGKVQVRSGSNVYQLTANCGEGRLTIHKGPLPNRQNFGGKNQEVLSVVAFDKKSGKAKAVASNGADVDLPRGLTLDRICSSEGPRDARHIVAAVTGIVYHY